MWPFNLAVIGVVLTAAATTTTLGAQIRVSHPIALTADTESPPLSQADTGVDSYLPRATSDEQSTFGGDTDYTHLEHIQPPLEGNYGGFNSEQFQYPAISLQAPYREAVDFYASVPVVVSAVAAPANPIDAIQQTDINTLVNNGGIGDYLVPPPISNEPNFYAQKPRKKSKKYQAGQKQVHIKQQTDEQNGRAAQESYVADQVQMLSGEAGQGGGDGGFTGGDYVYDYPFYGIGGQEQHNLPTTNGEHERDTIDGEEHKSNKHEQTTTQLPQTADGERKFDDSERVDFQMHGFAGPKSYKFGFDTGKGENRQFRFEESDADGNVKGHFGFFDETGKLHMTRYTSSPTQGFRTVDSTD